MTDTQTETKPAGIAEALADLQTQLPQIRKSETATVPTKAGGSYRYTYADLAQISREVLPILGKLGLSFTSRPTLREDGKFVLEYELLHISGESRTGVYPLSNSASPQEVGSSITYARRYCLCAITGIAPDDDDDAAAAEEAPKKRNRRDETGEGRINTGQQRALNELFRTALDATDGKETRLKYAAEVIGRDLGSATEMTRVEADQVIAKLKSFVAQSEPPAGDA